VDNLVVSLCDSRHNLGYVKVNLCPAPFNNLHNTPKALKKLANGTFPLASLIILYLVGVVKSKNKMLWIF
jgi:hypothetical protein